MTRKHSLPYFPRDYLGEKAVEYDNLAWMERNQKNTTLKCVEYLFDPTLGNYELMDYSNYLILDMGCGTGFSTEVLFNLGFNVVAIDILMDMLERAYQKKVCRYEKSLEELLLASISMLPFKPQIFDFILSISAYNFIIHNKSEIKSIKRVLNDTARTLSCILKEKGRMVIEFYPHNEKELHLFVSSFISNNFNGFYIKDNPDQTGGQTFLLLKKEVK
ncbi:MAG: SAM-dependent methyltransferase [Promethearchaeota archaeon]|nr:MAG: SAM-dependent methyltransferase [Candidatus Lokiarchaeota archaeon]